MQGIRSIQDFKITGCNILNCVFSNVTTFTHSFFHWQICFRILKSYFLTQNSYDTPATRASFV